MVFEPVDELEQQFLVAGQRIPQSAAQRQIVGQRRAQRGVHDTPPLGQGRANAASAVVSTFA